ncbi:hypothetical protein TNCV_84811 [Trichonephila clavipes]|nr:hypothetical protein TNCV_84811 [Trichonephila clavipes]
MREEFGKIKKAMKQVADGEREHKMLLQQMISENGAYAMNDILPSASGSKAANCAANISYRDSNGWKIQLEIVKIDFGMKIPTSEQIFNLCLILVKTREFGIHITSLLTLKLLMVASI